MRTRDVDATQWGITVLNRALSQADLAAVRTDAALLHDVLRDMDDALSVWPPKQPPITARPL